MPPVGFFRIETRVLVFCMPDQLVHVLTYLQRVFFQV